jgi:hypothetical protein
MRTKYWHTAGGEKYHLGGRVWFSDQYLYSSPKSSQCFTILGSSGRNFASGLLINV